MEQPNQDENLRQEVELLRARVAELESDIARQTLSEIPEQIEWAINAARIGTIDWNPQTDRIVPTPQLAQLLEYSMDEFSSLIESWPSLVHEEDLPTLREAMSTHLRGETPYIEIEYRARVASGEWRWFLGRGQLMQKDAQGNPIRVAGTILDIDQRKRAQEQLERNEAQYREYLMALEGIAFQTDDQFTHLVFLYGAVEKITGYTKDEFLSGKILWPDILAPEHAQRVLDAGVQFRASSKESVEMEYPIVRKDGVIRWVHYFLRRVVDENGIVTAYQGVIHDVTARHQHEDSLHRIKEELERSVTRRTAELARANDSLREEIAERKLAEQALRHSEQTARALLNVATEAAILVDLESRILTINETAARRLGGTVDELVGQLCFDLLPDDLADARKVQGIKVVETGTPVRFQDKRDGLIMDNHVYPIFDEDGNVVQLAIFNRDITDLKHAEAEILREQHLLHQLLNFQERERQLVAYEIHDGLAQELTGAIFRLQGFREQLPKNPEEAWKLFDVGLDLLSSGVQEARNLITGLRPPILDELGVVAAIEYLVCESQERGGPRIKFQHDLESSELVSSLQTAVFRIVQESLTNARRHSKSDHVQLKLFEQEGYVHIDVQDWGVGFDPAKVDRHHYGLEGLRERVRLLGGRMTINTEPGCGTRIHAELPTVGQADESIEEPIS